MAPTLISKFVIPAATGQLLNLFQIEKKEEEEEEVMGDGSKSLHWTRTLSIVSSSDFLVHLRNVTPLLTRVVV